MESMKSEAVNAEEVFQEYLKLTHSYNFLKYYICSNGVLDWFGRSIRGPLRIQDFFKNEIDMHYQHMDFSSGIFCEPIETEMGSKHLGTMKMPTEQLDDLIPPKNRLNKLGHLRSRADSDMECDAVERPSSPQSDGYRTPEKNVILIASTTDSTPSIESDSEADEEASLGPSKSKRLKLASPTKRIPSHSSRQLSMKKESSTRDCNNKESDRTQREATTSLSRPKYSELRYVQATGILRLKKQNGSGSDEDECDEWDRRVRIRLSYRRCWKDNQILFALIIYQHTDDTSNAIVKKPLARRKIDFDVGEDNDETEYCQDDEKLPSSSAHVMGRSLLATAIENDANDDASDDSDVNYAVTDIIVATVDNPDRETVVAALETAEFSITPPPILRTPTKSILIPPGTPKRKPRSSLRLEDDTEGVSPTRTSSLMPLKPAPPRRSAFRQLRL